MSQISFWDRVKHGCEKTGISIGTFNVWKHRGRVSREESINIFQALQGTEYEVSLDDLKRNHKQTIQ